MLNKIKVKNQQKSPRFSELVFQVRYSKIDKKNTLHKLRYIELN